MRSPKLSAMVCFVAALVAGTLGATTAEARQGVISGTFAFTNLNGNYCPSNQPCVGALYTQNQYGQPTGLPEAQVVLWKWNGTVVAVVPTSATGSYVLPWSIPESDCVGNPNCMVAAIGLFLVHAGGRFSFLPVSASATENYMNAADLLLLQNGTTNAAPQFYGGTLPNNPAWGAYWAAWKMWQRLATMPQQQGYFVDLEVLAFDTTHITDCATSCANPAFKQTTLLRPIWANEKMTIVMDGDVPTPFNPQERMMHEMGHVADFVGAHVGGTGRLVGLNVDRNTPGWTYRSAEYTTSSLNEGLATFLSTAGLYSFSADHPRTCLVDGSAPDAQNRDCWGATVATMSTFEDVESRGADACAAGEGRWQATSMRYLWDLFDAVNEPGETASLTIANIVGMTAAAPCFGYPNCVTSGELHDAWQSVDSTVNARAAPVNVSDADTNGVSWYKQVFAATYTGVLNQLATFNHNCAGSL